MQIRHVGPISLELAAGECVCISGASGAGKSLLLRAIADLEPHSGTALLDDTECSALKAPAWRRRVGLLPAESAWWYERVGAHFEAPRSDWFTRLGFPADVLDWEVGRLSTGERQRLALLRLLCNQPQALLLDEPTASLDPEAVGRVEALIAEYHTEHAAPVLWVSHDPRQIARVARRHYRIADGQLQEASL